ncbi:DUF4249 family protein [Saccharicrinis sp. FJH2]|uniref:DUF4249 family protein n=1 Tax=Saccharicrinis sp. FJH65 TaxID=3344659 RepID=UPI0035F3CD1D
MNLKKYYLIALMLLGLLSASCRKLVTDELPDMEARPVINSFFRSDEPIKIQLSLTSGFNYEELKLIDSALVYLEENGTIKDTLTCFGDGIYTSDFIPVANNRYRCLANYKDMAVAVAECRMPVKQEIISITQVDNAGIDKEGISYPAIHLEFTNDPSELLYFEVVVKLIREYNNYVWNEENGNLDKSTDTLIDIPALINITDPLILNEGLPLPVFSNELIEGSSYTMTLNYTTGSYSEDNTGKHTHLYPVVVELRSISYEYYRFVKQLYLYEQGRYPNVFGDVLRSFRLYSNVENGYGIFAAYSTCISDTIIPESVNN